MNRKNDYPAVDLYSIGKEMIRASQFEEMYYEMEKDRDYWKNKFWEVMESSDKHHKEMIGSLLELAITKVEN